MKTIRHLLPILSVLILLPSNPAAADGLFYLTGKISTTSASVDVAESFNLLLDGDDEGMAAGLGFKLGDHLAFELAYHDFGSFTAAADACPDCLDLVAPVSSDTTAISLTFLPHLLITDAVQAYAKVGVVSWETSLTEISSGLEDALDDYSDEDLVFGLGLRYLMPGPLGVYAEFERFSDSFESISLGATLGF